MTIKFLIIESNSNQTSNYAVYVRVINGRSFDKKAKTNLFVKQEWWDQKREMIKSRILCDPTFRDQVNSEIDELRGYITDMFNKDSFAGTLHKRWLNECIESFYAKKQQKKEQETKKLIREETEDLYNIFEEFLNKSNLSDSRRKQYEVIRRTLLRYELYIRYTRQHMRKYKIDVKSIDNNFLSDLYWYMENEHKIFTTIPEIYEPTEKKQEPKPRSKNTLADCFKKLRAFLNWCYANGYTKSKAFSNYKIESERYGTPYYLTLDELRTIHKKDLSDHPELNIQKDVFVFQCCIGCRVSDLLSFRKTDIINGNIEYIPKKTIGENPKTVVVPLNNMAQEIVAKYDSILEKQLLPFISASKYNEAIKSILEKCKITRMVTILDPLTRTEKKVPIHNIASSHMARRTFIGNIYKQVKDPNLVASLTGHVEGSKAFSRYRDIDTDIKRELVRLLE